MSRNPSDNVVVFYLILLEHRLFPTRVVVVVIVCAQWNLSKELTPW